MHFLESQFQNFLREGPGPLPIKGGSPPSRAPIKATTHLYFIVIVCHLLKVILPLPLLRRIPNYHFEITSQYYKY